MAPDLKDHKRIRYLTENASISGGEENITKIRKAKRKEIRKWKMGKQRKKGKRRKY